MTPTVIPEQAPAGLREHLPWGIFLLVAGAFLIMEHDSQGPRKFEMLVSAQSLDEFQNLEQQLFQSRSWRQAGGLMLGVFGLYSILRRRRETGHAMGFLAGLMILFVAWSLLSLAWADDPGVTFRRLALFVLIALGGFGITDWISRRQFLWLIVMWTGAYLAIAVGVEVIQGTFKPLAAGYRFAGTIHPNAQAVNCAILFLAVLHLLRDAGKRRGGLLLLLLLSFVFLYLTRSRTAFVSVISVLIVQWGIIQSRSVKVAIVSAVAVAALSLTLLSSVVWPVAQRGIAMGRSDASETTGTLTGRRQLWEQCLEFAAERPFLGYGYGGFWNQERSTEIINKQGWPISHAHNAYLDLLLEMGPAALICYVLILLVGITLAISYLRHSREASYSFFAMLLLFCAMNGLLESVAIQRGQITFIAIAVLVYLGFHRAPAEALGPAVVTQNAGVALGEVSRRESVA